MRRLFKRDRLTAQIAVGAVGVLAAAAVIFGIGMASAKYHLSDIGGWLSSDKKGEVVHVNGLTGQVDGKVQIAGANGHTLKVVQQGGSVLIVDETTGVASRIDPSQLSVVQGATYQGAQNMQVVAGNGVAYSLSPFKGSVQQLDPMTLATVGESTTLTAPLTTNNAIDANAALWVPVPVAGQAADKPNGQNVRGVPVGRPGDALTMTIAAGTPVVTDSTSAQSVIVGASGSQVKANLPPAVSQSGRAGVMAPTTTDGLLVPLLNAQSGALTILDATNGSVSSASLTLPRHAYGAPQMLGQRVYIPDKTAGNLLVYDNSSHSMQQSVPLTGRPDPSMDVFVKSGLLWVNDPQSNQALVVDQTGAWKPIQKYKGGVPGGANNPIPKAGAPNGDQGNPAPGNKGNTGNQPPASAPPLPPNHTQTPPPPHHNKPKPPAPPPDQPPTKPDPPTAQSADGSIQLNFTQSSGKNITGYTLKPAGSFSGSQISPASVSPTSPSDAFQVTGLPCQKGQTFAFKVEVHYTINGKPGTLDSDPSNAVQPCLPAAAPSNVTAKAETNGATVTWNAPSSQSQVTYSFKWSGPGGQGGNPTGISGTSQHVDASINGSYTFTVTAANGAGSTDAPAQSVPLQGPATSAVGQNAGNPGDTTNVCSSAQDCHDRGTITNYNGNSLTLMCQVKGGAYTHPGNVGSYYSGDMWDYISYGGHTGFIIGYLLKTSRQPDWQNYAGPPLWQCGSTGGP